MDPSSVKPPKDINASEYYKSQHSDDDKPTPVVIRPARTKNLKIAGILFLSGIVFAIIAVNTNIAGFLLEAASAISFTAAFVYLVIWSLKTIDKSVPGQ